MPETKTHEEAVQKISKMIKKSRIVMLTTFTEEGHLHARPMAMQDIEFDGDLWFFTGKSSPKVHQIEDQPRVNVAFSDPEHQNYVSLSGRASLVIDAQKNKQFWTPAFEAWFPEGLDDPELALLKIHVDGAEYWDAPSSTVAHVVGFVQAKLTGKPGDPGDHAKVEL
ncbi:General stress protein 26 [Abditibacterium utsteinense]|uniref:General stress protein 26 n=1 Tax=Abditibacterium utsteinense TaxID=1960156 RepID=A0A2S8SQT1_9BACT|nr:pyridoxamine 5'-phosphate oxidase family protein [Abditibacterium utsteinense]PQV63164.1 General stress protein 26 [Abditibacterium utsteinense]